MVTHKNLYERIIAICTELTVQDFIDRKIVLRDDGQGAYIEKWEHMTISRPTDEQLSAVLLPSE